MRIPNSRSLLLTEYAAIPKTPLIIALAPKAQAPASLLLFIPERYHRINPASSPGRNPAGQRRHTQEKRGNPNENGKVDYALGNCVNGNHERKYPSNGRAPGDYTQVFANNLQDDLPAGGPERQPHANLSRSPGHGVRNHGVDSDRREPSRSGPSTTNIRAGIRRR
jgi:hypothetical protein